MSNTYTNHLLFDSYTSLVWFICTVISLMYMMVNTAFPFLTLDSCSLVYRHVLLGNVSQLTLEMNVLFSGWFTDGYWRFKDDVLY